MSSGSDDDRPVVDGQQSSDDVAFDAVPSASCGDYPDPTSALKGGNLVTTDDGGDSAGAEGVGIGDGSTSEEPRPERRAAAGGADGRADLESGVDRLLVRHRK